MFQALNDFLDYRQNWWTYSFDIPPLPPQMRLFLEYPFNLRGKLKNKRIYKLESCMKIK